LPDPVLPAMRTCCRTHFAEQRFAGATGALAAIGDGDCESVRRVDRADRVRRVGSDFEFDDDAGGGPHGGFADAADPGSRISGWWGGAGQNSRVIESVGCADQWAATGSC